MDRKVSDRFTVPICRLHHRQLHRRGNECACSLWAKTHATEPAAADVVSEADRSAKINIEINGRQFGNGAAAAVTDRRQKATLWHQARQVLFTLQCLDRRKPWERLRMRGTRDQFP
jgi:hypothetical protein